jgi:hypothetical protein
MNETEKDVRSDIKPGASLPQLERILRLLSMPCGAPSTGIPTPKPRRTNATRTKSIEATSRRQRNCSPTWPNTTAPPLHATRISQAGRRPTWSWQPRKTRKSRDSANVAHCWTRFSARRSVTSTSTKANARQDGWLKRKKQ